MKIFFLNIFLFASLLSYAQTADYASKSTKKFVKEVTRVIHSGSLFSDSLDWKQISKDRKSFPFVGNDSIDRKLVIDYFTKKLKGAGDKHSFFLTEKNKESYLVKNPEPAEPQSKYLGEGIGYIKIPQCLNFSDVKDKAFANTIRHQIQALDTTYNIRSWIVDLRHNGGGNMWPMLAGLNALSEDGLVGYLIGKKSGKDIKWQAENGKIFYTKLTVDTYKVKNLHNNIAVLIDSMTGSSGEMTAISLIGRPNTMLFGQPSAGYTTGNITVDLSDGTQLYLAANYVADRNHKIYPDNVVPDVIIAQGKSGEDETIASAKKWLHESAK